MPQSLLKGVGSLKEFDDGEICVKSLGIVFVGKNKNSKNTKFLFRVEHVERYTNSRYINLLIRINNCKRNIEGDKADIRRTIVWYMEIRRVLHQATKMLMT